MNYYGLSPAHRCSDTISCLSSHSQTHTHHLGSAIHRRSWLTFQLKSLSVYGHRIGRRKHKWTRMSDTFSPPVHKRQTHHMHIIFACVRLHMHCKFRVHLANNIQFIIAICTNYWITVYAKMHEARAGRTPSTNCTHSPCTFVGKWSAIAAPKSIIIRKCEMWCIRFRPAITVKLMRPKRHWNPFEPNAERAIAVSDHYCFPISAQTAHTKIHRSMFYRARLIFLYHQHHTLSYHRMACVNGSVKLAQLIAFLGWFICDLFKRH